MMRLIVFGSASSSGPNHANLCWLEETALISQALLPACSRYLLRKLEVPRTIILLPLAAMMAFTLVAASSRLRT